MNKKNPKLLLHICCAVCGGPVIERLESEYEIILYYFNPNIYPPAEYEKREKYVKLIAENLGLDLVLGVYDHSAWLKEVRGFEQEPERGKRCEICFRYRLRETAILAKKKEIPFFSTTLTISPWKNAIIINQVGSEIAKEIAIEYLERNDKKKDGYKRAVELAKEGNIYQQDYCGCEFSIRK